MRTPEAVAQDAVQDAARAGVQPRVLFMAQRG
jgi:hypothetical protein